MQNYNAAKIQNKATGRHSFRRAKFFLREVVQRLKKSVFLQPQNYGEMAEWSKARAWRARKRQKRFMGSNPILSAKT